MNKSNWNNFWKIEYPDLNGMHWCHAEKISKSWIVYIHIVIETIEVISTVNKYANNHFSIKQGIL